ncbi:MAG: zinc-binding dehydrogenase [Chloroflexota bacterium]|nr:zinc-binding dehydrogenase [Chloroflexota bacterium]
MTQSIPPTGSALVLQSYAPEPFAVTLETLPMPQPGKDELLVQVLASPINPSDLMFLQGMYGVRKPLPCVPGFEAAARVVAVGEGVDSAWIGRRVACFAAHSSGAWATHMVTHVSTCFPVDDRISDEQAALALVNPLTAIALVEQALQAGATAIVQTAAGSALGRMIERLATAHGIAVINVVRRAEQAAELQAAGSAHVLDNSDTTFDGRLRLVCRDLNARLAFDAVGGELTGQLLRALPNGGKVTVYGGLALQPCSVPVDQLIFKQKSVDGFWLSQWLRITPHAEQQAAWTAVQPQLSDTLRSDVRARYGLSDAALALGEYNAQMSGGKVLFVPV